MGKAFHPLRGRSLSAVLPDRPDLRRQKSFSSLAEPRLANIEVTSNWSTESSPSQSAATKLVAVQRRGETGPPAVSRCNPFLDGFASLACQDSNSNSKRGTRLPHLRPSHQRHVSAPMVSSSIANFVIPTPLECRPREQERLHRRATTSRSRQPSRLNMNLNPQTQAGSCDTPQERRRPNSNTFSTSVESQEQSHNRESSTPSQKASKWGRDLLSWKITSSLVSPTVGEAHNDLIKCSQAQVASCSESAFDDEDDGEETEVFLGFNDI